MHYNPRDSTKTIEWGSVFPSTRTIRMSECRSSKYPVSEDVAKFQITFGMVVSTVMEIGSDCSLTLPALSRTSAAKRTYSIRNACKRVKPIRIRCTFMKQRTVSVPGHFIIRYNREIEAYRFRIYNAVYFAEANIIRSHQFRLQHSGSGSIQNKRYGSDDVRPVPSVARIVRMFLPSVRAEPSKA